jgi:hypothetical protein
MEYVRSSIRFVYGTYSDSVLRKRAILWLIPVVFVTVCVSGVIGHLTNNAGPLWAIVWVLLTVVVLWFLGLLLLAAVQWIGEIAGRGSGGPSSR